MPKKNKRTPKPLDTIRFTRQPSGESNNIETCEAHALISDAIDRKNLSPLAISMIFVAELIFATKDLATGPAVELFDDIAVTLGEEMIKRERLLEEAQDEKEV